MLVDCVTYVVCSSVGLDIGGESIPYIAGWGENGGLDAIREYAHTIDAIARRIEDALNGDPPRRRPRSPRRRPDPADAHPTRSGLLVAPVSDEPARLSTRQKRARRGLVAGPASPAEGRKQPPTERSPP